MMAPECYEAAARATARVRTASSGSSSQDAVEPDGDAGAFPGWKFGTRKRTELAEQRVAVMERSDSESKSEEEEEVDSSHSSDGRARVKEVDLDSGESFQSSSSTVLDSNLRGHDQAPPAAEAASGWCGRSVDLP